MSDELISAALDGQCSSEELQRVLAVLERSAECRARWSRMALTRDALLGVRVERAAPEFVGNVMAAIEAIEIDQLPAGSNVVPLRAAPQPMVARPQRRSRRRWQPVVGLAAAASITAAVIVAGNTLLSHPVAGPVAGAGSVAATTTPAARTVVASSQAPTAALTAVANDQTGAGGELAETRWTQIDAAAARQLNDFLMEHSNSRSEAGMGGSLSYARLAVRSADYRPADGQH